MLNLDAEQQAALQSLAEALANAKANELRSVVTMFATGLLDALTRKGLLDETDVGQMLAKMDVIAASSSSGAKRDAVTDVTMLLRHSLSIGAATKN